MKFLLAGLLIFATAFSAAGKDTDSLDLKIGQMIMIGIGERTTLSQNDPLRAELAAGKVGGVVLFEKNLSATASSERLRALIKALRQESQQPLFVSIDEEGGNVHRLKPKYGFFTMPSAASLGKSDDADLTLHYNRKLARLLKDLGFNVNYSPSVDVAVNPGNTVIVKAERSFGSSPSLVARQAALVIQAHRENGVATVLKHFPGHGSSTTDSHFGVVDVTKTWKPLELRPYDTLIRAGLCDAVMVAHIINKNWDSDMLPASLSQKVVNGMLRKNLGFNGVVFSDDMQMKAIADHYGLERAIVLAINAGVDVLMFANTIPDAANRVTASQIHAIIKKLVLNGTVSRKRIDESYQRIVAMKAKYP
jgi:beta-N-acetylhexosaminidase